MGFLHDRLTEAKDAVAAGQPEQAAETIVHALLEGPGTFDQNLTDIVSENPDK
ncbi:hypothetical protein [Streptomyces sp. NPDC056160]|uniref:hypothetical protein n=1 Tax=Streptomyces sp. NPDC056160 TaxID=3345731 RepID=UPI0035D5FC0F